MSESEFVPGNRFFVASDKQVIACPPITTHRLDINGDNVDMTRQGATFDGLPTHSLSMNVYSCCSWKQRKSEAFYSGFFCDAESGPAPVLMLI